MEPFNGINVLFAEDDKDYSEPVGKELRRLGCSVTICDKGDQVFRFLKGIIPEIIILDVNLPVKNGDTICKELKADKRYSEIPIIFLTAASEGSSSETFSLRLNDETIADAIVLKSYGSNVNLVTSMKKLLDR